MDGLYTYFSREYLTSKWKHDGFQKYLKNTGWMFLSRILSMVIAFVSTIIIARQLGPTNLGELNYAISLIGIFSIVGILCIDEIVYRELIKRPQERQRILGSTFTIKLFFGVCTVPLVALFAIFFAQNDVSRILICILAGTFLFSPFQIIGHEFQARVNAKYASLIVLGVTAIINILKVIVVLLGFGVIYLALVLLLQSILYAVAYWMVYVYIFRERPFELDFDWITAKSLLQDSWPLLLVSGFMLIYGRIDQVFIKNMIDANAVGIYSAAVTIVEAWYFVHFVVMISLFPAIINARQTSYELYAGRMRKLFLLLMATSAGIALITTLGATIIIWVVYGTEFAGAEHVLKIYIWSLIGSALAHMASSYLIAENKRWTLLLITFIPMITNVLLNLVLIPQLGIAGSAWATLVSYTLGPLSLLLFKEPRRLILFPQRS